MKKLQKMLHIYSNIKNQKITNQYYTCGSRSKTDKYNLKKTGIRTYDYKKLSDAGSTFKFLLLYKIYFN